MSRLDKGKHVHTLDSFQQLPVSSALPGVTHITKAAMGSSKDRAIEGYNAD